MGDCRICLHALKFPLLRCENNHEFHRHCILLWNEEKLECPLCRSTYYPPEKEDVVTLRNLKNPTREEVLRIIEYNPFQIRFLRGEEFDNAFYEKCALVAVNKNPSALVAMRAPRPLALKLLAFSKKPDLVTKIHDEPLTIFEALISVGASSSLLSYCLEQVSDLNVQEEIHLKITALKRPTKEVLTTLKNDDAINQLAFRMSPRTVRIVPHMSFSYCCLVLNTHPFLFKKYCVAWLRTNLPASYKTICQLLIDYPHLIEFFNFDESLCFFAINQDESVWPLCQNQAAVVDLFLRKDGLNINQLKTKTLANWRTALSTNFKKVFPLVRAADLSWRLTTFILEQQPAYFKKVKRIRFHDKKFIKRLNEKFCEKNKPTS